MKNPLPAITGIGLAVYPLAVIAGIRFWEVGTLWMVLLGLMTLRLLSARWFHRQTLILQGSLVVILGILLALPLWLELDFMLGIRFYPVLANLAVFSLFFSSLFSERPLVERIARLREGKLPPEAIPYTRQVTRVWSLFLFANSLVALATALWAPDWLWGLYNGLISYLLVATLFAIEYGIRQHQRRRWSAP
ncbi:putative membrane protein [Natronospira proteinivora]|uniref:Membrane protein n=1 Tax=Natronospira proteinivora TaxID=1807133 RepID=A0ABT1G8U2_9GAMM|nr:hypothetical protein [Natronospira proteinivora]MCP1727727.1 putative membrane protein [Natronospira proteinivora]